MLSGFELYPRWLPLRLLHLWPLGDDIILPAKAAGLPDKFPPFFSQPRDGCPAQSHSSVHYGCDEAEM